MAKDDVRIRDAITMFEVTKPRASIVKKSGDVGAMNGLDVVFVDDKDIRALQSGKVLYFSDGEYAHLIVRCE